jgi:hypothetical protein
MSPSPDFRPAFTALCALALASAALLSALAAPAWAGDDDPPPLLLGPGGSYLVDGPAGPALGVRSQALSYSQVLNGCTSASVFVQDDGRSVAVCLNGVYNTDDEQVGSTTAGAWAKADARLPLPDGLALPWAPATSDKPWWWGDNNLMSQGAAARSMASPRDLRAGAFAVHEQDRVWNWNPEDDTPFNGSGQGIGHEGVGEFTRASASAEARSVDQITVHGSGRVIFHFNLDGLYEAGRSGPAPGGGSFAFGVALYDRSQLRWLNTGDFIIPIWLTAAFRTEGISYNADETAPGPEFGQLLDEPAFAGQPVDRFGGDAPEGTLFDGGFTVALSVLDGTELTLVTALQVGAWGFDRCDSEPGNGRGCISGGDTLDNSTLIDFSSSARLTGVEIDSDIIGLSSASGVDYMALATVVPEPATWALGLLGGAVVLRAGRRRGFGGCS